MPARKTTKPKRPRPVEHVDRLDVRVPHGAKERWNAAAKRARRSFSDWVRQTLDDAAGRK